MPSAIILAIGVDSSLIRDRGTIWQSSGYFVRSVGTIREAIGYFRDGDFDLVLVGHSVPAESRERFVFSIRRSGSRIPVVSIADSADDVMLLRTRQLSTNPACSTSPFDLKCSVTRKCDPLCR